MIDHNTLVMLVGVVLVWVGGFLSTRGRILSSCFLGFSGGYLLSEWFLRV